MSAGAVCSIEESSGPQKTRVPILLRASKSASVKGVGKKIYRSTSKVSNAKFSDIDFDIHTK